jgi:phosphate transport system ATP-binding protein
MIEDTEVTPDVDERGRVVPPPVRRIVVDAPPTVVRPALADDGAVRHHGRGTAGPERMSVDELSVFYGAKPAVKQVTLPMRQGEVLALIGPSGCGKTTLLRTLNRLT